MSNSVFMKKEPQNLKIDYPSIVNTIPKNSYIEPQLDKNNKTETRWRFLCIPQQNLPSNDPNSKSRKFVEISRKRPNNTREYLKYMKWVECVVDSVFDQYVVKQYYYYSDE